jgi:adenylate kinase family enzyme
MPVVDYYRKQNKVVDVSCPARTPSPSHSWIRVLTLLVRYQIDSSKTIDEVHQDIITAIKPVIN